MHRRLTTLGAGLALVMVAALSIALMRMQSPAEAEVAHPPFAPAAQVPLPPQPAPTSAVDIACPNSHRVRTEMRLAPDGQATGDVLLEFVVDANGRIRDTQVVQSTDTALERAALAAVQRFRCISQGQEVRVQVPFAYRRER